MADLDLVQCSVCGVFFNPESDHDCEDDPPPPEDDPPAPTEDEDDPPTMSGEEFVSGLEPLSDEELKAVGQQAFKLRYED